MAAAGAGGGNAGVAAAVAPAAPATAPAAAPAAAGATAAEAETEVARARGVLADTLRESDAALGGVEGAADRLRRLADCPAQALQAGQGVPADEAIAGAATRIEYGAEARAGVSVGDALAQGARGAGEAIADVALVVTEPELHLDRVVRLEGHRAGGVGHEAGLAGVARGI